MMKLAITSLPGGEGPLVHVGEITQISIYYLRTNRLLFRVQVPGMPIQDADRLGRKYARELAEIWTSTP